MIFITPTIIDADYYVPDSTKDMKKEISKNPWGDADNDKEDKGIDSR